MGWTERAEIGGGEGWNGDTDRGNGDGGTCVRENNRTSTQGKSARAQDAWRGVRIFLSDDILTFTQAPVKIDHKTQYCTWGKARLNKHE